MIKALSRTPTKHKGAHSELIACAWLLAGGHEVFRNVSAHGKIDVIAIKNGEVQYFNITSSPDKKFRRRMTQEEISLRILPLYVYEDGSITIDESPLPRFEFAANAAVCVQCNRTFNKKREAQMFCCIKCGTDNWRHRTGLTPVPVICPVCQTPVRKRSGSQKFCTAACRKIFAQKTNNIGGINEAV